MTMRDTVGTSEQSSNIGSHRENRRFVRIQRADEIVAAGVAKRRLVEEPLSWSRPHIGVGVMQALRSRQRITFAEMQPPQTQIDMETMRFPRPWIPAAGLSSRQARRIVWH